MLLNWNTNQISWKPEITILISLELDELYKIETRLTIGCEWYFGIKCELGPAAKPTKRYMIRLPITSQSFIEFQWVSMSFTEFQWVSMGFNGFKWVLLGFTGFYWVLLGFMWFYWVLYGFNGFHWVLLGFTEFY